MSLTNLKYKDVYFDSDEEVFVAMWLEELRQAGFVKEWKKPIHAAPLTPGYKIKYTKKTKLKTKIKEEIKELLILRPSEYTPDFYVEFTTKGFEKFITEIKYHTSDLELKPQSLFYTSYPKDLVAALEVKPLFDMQNMQRGFIHKQKYLWDKYQIFVNLVEPIELFKKTFLPSLAAPYFKYRKSPTGKNKGKKVVGDWKMDWIPKTINEFLNIK